MDINHSIYNICTTQGGMAALQGGKFWSGFAAGALSSIMSSAWTGGGSFKVNEGVKTGSIIQGIGGANATNMVGTMFVGTISGGAGAALTGGNFWQGAVTGLIVSGLNHKLHNAVNSTEEKPESIFEFTSDYTKAPLVIEQSVGDSFTTDWIKSTADSNIITIGAGGALGAITAPLAFGVKASTLIGGVTALTNSYSVQNKFSYTSVNKTLWYGKVTHNIFTGKITNVSQTKIVNVSQNIITKIQQRVVHDFSGKVLGNSVHNINRYTQIINNPIPRVGMNINQW